MNAPLQPSAPVWIAVIDPETESGRAVITGWDSGTPSEWAVPDGAEADDFVLGWVTGGTGFRYLFQITGSPRPATEDEFGPQQAVLTVLETFEPSVPMPRLKADPALRSWWLVRYSMQGVVKTQQESLSKDREWNVFLALLESAAPKVAARLRGTRNSAAPETGVAVAEQAIDTVTFLDEGSEVPVEAAVSRGLGSVLARAAAINEKRNSADLSFSSLLLALTYGGDPLGQWLSEYFERAGVKVDYLLNRVRKGDSAQEAAERGNRERDAILGEPLRRSPSARRALDEAARIADGQGATVMDSRHLVAAMIALTDYHEEDFGALTLDRPRWGAAFVQHIARQSDGAEVDFWRRFYTRRFPGHELPPLDALDRPGHRPDYDADAYTSHDLLAIDDEVSALAYVIASKQTTPPLAIGLFGEWGSGKTFFMKHLRRRIDRLCQGARKQPAADRECHAQIAQIEFNAWHYQEGDLWASLVDHILRNLRFGEDEDEARVAERRDQMVRELDVTEARQTAAAKRVEEADSKVTSAEIKLEGLKEKERQRRTELAATLTPSGLLAAARAGASIDEATEKQAQEVTAQLGIQVVKRNAEGLQDAISEAERELAGAWAFLLPLFNASDRLRRIVLLAVAALVPLALWIWTSARLSEYDLVGRISSAVVGLGTFLAAATSWIRSQTTWVRELRAKVEPVARKIDEAVERGIEAQLTVQKQAVVDALAELDTLRVDQAQAQKERDDAAAQAAAIRGSIAVLGDDGLMRAFLDERIGGGVYQQKLGIAALVRRDFERLSRKIQQVSDRESTGNIKTGELVVNRIVLYIDDLDRCEMDKVVPVLRAVHLLLAFPAFVVVVGVDSRWVARCLERHHPDIFQDDQQDASHPGVTPLDYLEKIFQIPIWLEPVPPDRRVSMVRALLRKPPRPAAAVATPAPEPKPKAAQTQDSYDPNDAAAQQPVTPATEPSQVQEVVQTQAADTGHQDTGEPPIDLKPTGLTISDDELDFLDQLGVLLSSSPRTIKRFVNTYRLISVALAQAELHDSELRPRDSEIRMLLLAILVGMPDLSRWLQSALADPNGPNPALTSLVTVMETLAADESIAESQVRAIAQWSIVRQWIEQRGEPWTTMSAARVTEWLEPVGRYTFNLTRTTTTPRPVVVPLA